jgi:hypothetical protein
VGVPGQQKPLHFDPAKDTDRDAVKQRSGGEQLLGWFAKYAPSDRITRITRNQWPIYEQLWDLLKEMNDLLEFHMPDYYKFHHKMALTLARPGTPGDEDSVDNGLTNGDLKYPHKAQYKDNITGTLSWSPDYTIWVTDFSTVQVNKSIVFTDHQDGNNIAGTLGCITTFGEFAGGPLVFPRFGVGADVGVRDMLVCDSNSEHHGNLGPIVGTRFSVVAFLHNTLQTQEARQREKEEAIVRSHNWEHGNRTRLPDGSYSLEDRCRCGVVRVARWDADPAHPKFSMYPPYRYETKKGKPLRNLGICRALSS